LREKFENLKEVSETLLQTGQRMDVLVPSTNEYASLILREPNLVVHMDEIALLAINYALNVDL
jgi:hypothetical protein